MKGTIGRLVIGIPLGSYSALVLKGLVIACLLSLSSLAMAQPIDRQYWVNIHTQGAAWTLRINDINVRSHKLTEQYSISYPISTSLREGQNTVSFIYAPLIEQDSKTGEFIQGPKPTFYVDVSIEAINTSTQQKERINTLQLRYDMDTGELVDFPNNPANPLGETTHQTEHLRTRGEFQVSSPDRLAIDNGDLLAAERVDMSFRLLDTIPDFHWVNDATPLRDTLQLRHELRQAYERLHRLFEEGNTDAIVREFEPVWDRAGLLMAGGKSARDYIESLPVGSQLVGLHQESNGPVLQPLDIADDPAGDSLEFMGDGRLVRILPSPIYWSYPDQPDKEETAIPMLFYRTSAGEWRIAAVAS